MWSASPTTSSRKDGEAMITAGFTNGILSTQNLRQQLKTPKGQAPSKKQLEQHIDTDKPDAIREFLTADALPLISSFVGRAKAENCDLYCALYELNDPSLLDLLQANADRSISFSRPPAAQSRRRDRTASRVGQTNTQSRAGCGKSGRIPRPHVQQLRSYRPQQIRGAGRSPTTRPRRCSPAAPIGHSPGCAPSPTT